MSDFQNVLIPDHNPKTCSVVVKISDHRPKTCSVESRELCNCWLVVYKYSPALETYRRNLLFSHENLLLGVENLFFANFPCKTLSLNF